MSLPGVGDDGALVAAPAGGTLVLALDTLVEGAPFPGGLRRALRRPPRARRQPSRPRGDGRGARLGAARLDAAVRRRALAVRLFGGLRHARAPPRRRPRRRRHDPRAADGVGDARGHGSGGPRPPARGRASGRRPLGQRHAGRRGRRARDPAGPAGRAGTGARCAARALPAAAGARRARGRAARHRDRLHRCFGRPARATSPSYVPRAASAPTSRAANCRCPQASARWRRPEARIAYALGGGDDYELLFTRGSRHPGAARGARRRRRAAAHRHDRRRRMACCVDGAPPSSEMPVTVSTTSREGRPAPGEARSGSRFRPVLTKYPRGRSGDTRAPDLPTRSRPSQPQPCRRSCGPPRARPASASASASTT